LTELLRTRSGRIFDVLEIEQEVTRVRLDIERLIAEKTNVTRRASYATIDVVITEERKESIDGPLSFTTRMRRAIRDSGSAIRNSGSRIRDSGSRMRDSGSRIRDSGSAIRDQGFTETHGFGMKSCSYRFTA
jgi:hypothetical protein